MNTTDCILDLINMGFVISKKRGEPYIIDRLNHGNGIFGPQNYVGLYKERGKRAGLEKAVNSEVKGMEGVYDEKPKECFKGSYTKNLRKISKIDRGKWISRDYNGK